MCSDWLKCVCSFARAARLQTGSDGHTRRGSVLFQAPTEAELKVFEGGFCRVQGDVGPIMSCLGRPKTPAFISLTPKHAEKVAHDPEGWWRKDQREMKLKTEIYASIRKKINTADRRRVFLSFLPLPAAESVSVIWLQSLVTSRAQRTSLLWLGELRGAPGMLSGQLYSK